LSCFVIPYVLAVILFNSNRVSDELDIIIRNENCNITIHPPTDDITEFFIHPNKSIIVDGREIKENEGTLCLISNFTDENKD